MFSNSNTIINGGTFLHYSGSRKGLDILHQHMSPGAFHNSGERFDPPKCHPNTRVAVLRIIMGWVEESQRKFPMLWLHGPAGAGKSAIAQTIAEMCHALGLLLASFFFSRTAEGRNNGKKLIPTIAYQIAISFPTTREHIEQAVESDPSLVDKSLEAQIQSLIVQPLQLAYEAIPSEQPPRLIIIDGLDECHDPKVQIHILHVLSEILRQNNLSLALFIASRPEHHLCAAFDMGHLNLLSTRLHLDDSFHPDDDIRQFLVDKFDDMKREHPFRSHIPDSWPSPDVIYNLVRKSSGQFIFASTVVRFVGSIHDLPGERLDIILGLSAQDEDSPFGELDALYSHIFSSVKGLKSALRILAFKMNEGTNLNIGTTLNPRFFETQAVFTIEQFLLLKEGEMRYCLANLDLVLIQVIDDGCDLRFLHASLQDFLVDRSRSGRFHIDKEHAHADIAICYMKYYTMHKDRKNNIDLWACLSQHLRAAAPTDELRQEILQFDIMSAAMQKHYVLYKRRDYESYEFLGEVFSSISASKFADADSLYRLVHRKIDNHFKEHLPAYHSNETLRDLLVLVAGGSPFTCAYDEGVDTRPIPGSPPSVMRYHPFWRELKCRLGQDTFKRDRDALNLVQLLNDKYHHPQALVLLRDFLRDHRRADHFYVSDKDIARMAFRCLQSVVNCLTPLNQDLRNRDYHLHLLNPDDLGNSADDSTGLTRLEARTISILLEEVMPLLSLAAPLPELVSFMDQPRVAELLKVFKLAYMRPRVSAIFETYVKRCHEAERLLALAPLNLFNPITTMPVESRLSRTLLGMVFPRHLQSGLL
ncbi:hypothetical protein BYT27DRAFT_6753765 [Phlegmacium glaucopus]|nr:hypothetical protein BYT27DRAFT_6753765 [Phlegmacium glaucopus]